ncbi:molybdenum cofactor biosynthesis F family protein [Arthrobacter sp.]|uniref:molybdenum cofactor biosynthesis F family protein n=1 Tax=Arthrobacter sp. TaxID=1667 RepID=UPI00289AB55B|nr:molybdenum cofactor biosynthesis F family protein [Arthrobacter sp.]
MRTTQNPADTSTWLPLDGLAPGFDANKAPLTGALAGRRINLTMADGTRIAHKFGTETVAWSFQPPGHAVQEGEDPYEAFEVAPGLFYAQFQHVSSPKEAVSLFLDLDSGRALSVISTIGTASPAHTAVGQQFIAGTIDGAEVDGSEPAPSAALVGGRVLWEYSTEHAYEHLYLSPHWYTWQCLSGPERGLADTDQQTTYELRPGIFVFAWREKVVPCAAVTVADHRDAAALRSHGSLFGLHQDGSQPVHFTFGAHGRLLSRTSHPAALDPALTW